MFGEVSRDKRWVGEYEVAVVVATRCCRPVSEQGVVYYEDQGIGCGVAAWYRGVYKAGEIILFFSIT